MKYTDYIGKTFGKLTVIELDHRNKYRNAVLRCLCSCGNPKNVLVLPGDLTRIKGPTTSCKRCSEFELPGKIFGNLKVETFHYRNTCGLAYFICSCSCGNPKKSVIPGYSLTRKDNSTRQCRICANKLRTYIGKNEAHLLDLKEKELAIDIERQVTFGNYVVDGYCRETNTIFEVYETYHDRKAMRDLERQQYLTQQLNCNFVIIPDRSH